MKIAIQYLTEKAAARGLDLPLLIDRMAFKDAFPDSVDTMEFDIVFPTFVRTMTFRRYLDLCVSLLPGDSTFLIRDDQIFILPGAAAKIERLLDRKVSVDLRNKPLLAAFEELADRTGLGIAVDPRCDDGNKKTVTLLSEQGMTMRAHSNRSPT